LTPHLSPPPQGGGRRYGVLYLGRGRFLAPLPLVGERPGGGGFFSPLPPRGEGPGVGFISPLPPCGGGAGGGGDRSRQLQQEQRRVGVRRDDVFAVRRRRQVAHERPRRHRRHVEVELPSLLPRRRLPHPHQVVVAGRREVLAVRRHGERREAPF